jgi:hypothetical protein
MSNSPKYSRPRLREAQERRLREERQRQARLEEECRRREEAERRRRRFEEAQNQARGGVRSAASRVSDLSRNDLARYIPADLERFRGQLQAIEEAVVAAGDEEAVRRQERQLEQLGFEIARAVTRGEAARLDAQVADQAAALAAVRRIAAALDEHRSLRFDAAGLQAVKSAITQADAAVAKKSLAQAQQCVAQARQHIERHQAEVESQFARWSGARSACRLSLDEAGDRLAGLEADAVVARWVGRDVAQVRERLKRAEALGEADQFPSASAEAAAVAAECGRLAETAQQVQLNEDRRQYVMRGILQVMERMGFVVQSGSPALEHSDYPQSACIIQAKRIAGERLAVSIPQEGDVWYAVEGFPMRAESSRDGGTVATCDEAQTQIENMHRALEEAFGIQMSELTWEGKDPTRIRKQAERLPDTTSQSSPRSRSSGQP